MQTAAKTARAKQKEAFKSLKEFTGETAGPDLGLEAYFFACQNNEPIKIRNVKTKKYTGKINRYRESFLQYFFHPDTNRTAAKSAVETFKIANNIK